MTDQGFSSLGSVSLSVKWGRLQTDLTKQLGRGDTGGEVPECPPVQAPSRYPRGRCGARPAQAQGHPLLFHSQNHRTLAASAMPTSEF